MSDIVERLKTVPDSMADCARLEIERLRKEVIALGTNVTASEMWSSLADRCEHAETALSQSQVREKRMREAVDAANELRRLQLRQAMLRQNDRARESIMLCVPILTATKKLDDALAALDTGESK